MIAVHKTHLRQFDVLWQEIEERIGVLAPRRNEGGRRIAGAMRYSLLNGGKRLRPLFTLVVTEVFDGHRNRALDPACAVEMLHTASLVLDDLPCMDDAVQRRGKQASHLSFGEDIAILSAVALISRAFQVVLEAPQLDTTERVRITGILARAIGLGGLSGGQEMDLYADAGPCEGLAAIGNMHRQKTGVLFEAAMEIGILLGHSDGDGKAQEWTTALRTYGRHLGQAFQIFDDLLDVAGDVGRMGKDLGKPSLASLLTPEEMKGRALAECAAAGEALAAFDGRDAPLTAFLEMIISSYERQLSS